MRGQDALATAGRMPALPVLAGCRHAERADALERSVDYGLEFVSVFDFAALGQEHARSVSIEPGGITVVFIGSARLPDVHQEGFDDILLHASGLPEHAFGMNVNVEVSRLDEADGARFFFGFALGGLAVREARFGGSLGKCPLAAAIGVDQQKLGMR